MNYIKKHKLTSFVILVYIIVVAFAYFLYKLFIGSSGLPVYGDRLDGIENVPISEEQKDKIVEELSNTDFVIKVTRPYLNGKILKVVFTVADSADLQLSKQLDSIVYGALTEEQRAFYDVEIFIAKNYNCTLEATGKMDEDGNFINDVEVRFIEDLSKNQNVIDYGISSTDNSEFNKNQSIVVNEDGEHIIYGFTKDKMGDSKCSIKIVRKVSDATANLQKINTISVDRNFPTIGYMKAGTNRFVWAKTV